VATPGALEALRAHDVTPATLLGRHLHGDWGEIDREDRGLNERALRTGERLLSVYQIGEETRIWIITEAEDDAGEREATTLLLPEEY
jgi:hypothetical protein